MTNRRRAGFRDLPAPGFEKFVRQQCPNPHPEALPATRFPIAPGVSISFRMRAQECTANRPNEALRLPHLRDAGYMAMGELG